MTTIIHSNRSRYIILKMFIMYVMRKRVLIIILAILLFTRLLGLSWGLPYPMHPDERNMADAIMRLECDITTAVHDTENIIGGVNIENPTTSPTNTTPTPTTLLNKLRACMNPEFFAYGQPPLYAAYILIKAWHVTKGAWHIVTGAWHIATLNLQQSITFTEAVMALRLISVAASIATVMVLYEIARHIAMRMSKRVQVLFTQNRALIILALGISPYFIQFSHFGTTESLLMLLYSSIVLFSIRLLEKINIKKIAITSILIGISTSVKISAAVFGVVPAFAVVIALFRKHNLVIYSPEKHNSIKHNLVKLSLGKLSHIKLNSIKLNPGKLSLIKNGIAQDIKQAARYTLLMLFIAVPTALILSPQSILNYQDFFLSMNYEIGIGNGAFRVFYTRQFENTIPVLYHFIKVFPYALGLPQLLLFVGGFFLLPWRDGRINLLRIAFLLYFIPSTFLYTKWTRFMTPVMPVMTVIAVIFMLMIIAALIDKLRLHIQTHGRIVLMSAVILLILPGIAYLSVYTTRDVRFSASEWMIENIPPGSVVMVEEGNVINIPVQTPERTLLYPQFTVALVDLYGADESFQKAADLQRAAESADYIVIASRRMFTSHSCALPQDYSNAYERSRIRNPLVSGKYPDWCQQKRLEYPIVNGFFDSLFADDVSGRFELIHIIESYPRIGPLEFRDELAEEAWTVFDHPVVRVYRSVR